MALFNTSQGQAAVVGRRVHQGVVTHDGDAVSGPKGRRAEVRARKGRRPRHLDEWQLGRLVFRPVGIVRGEAADAHVAAIVGRRPVLPRTQFNARLRPRSPRWPPRAIETATGRAGRVGHLDVATAARHLGLVLAVGTPRRAADPGQRHAPPTHKPNTPPPPDLGSIS